MGLLLIPDKTGENSKRVKCVASSTPGPDPWLGLLAHMGEVGIYASKF